MESKIPRVSNCRTHHLGPNGAPLYPDRFNNALAFHSVEDRLIAAVKKGHHAWHIDISGCPIYPDRFLRTFGYYCGYAAVIAGPGWFHINPDGKPLYDQRYAFAGNFQQNIAVVCDAADTYFHIGLRGEPKYPQRWKYCGDYRDGYAVVQAANGFSSHIDEVGDFLHGKWFLDLDVYHKGFARARDRRGWCHIDRDGLPIYQERYMSVEAFYNGAARCECIDGALVVINETGRKIRTLRNPTADHYSKAANFAK